jgi:hypothetical protein
VLAIEPVAQLRERAMQSRAHRRARHALRARDLLGCPAPVEAQQHRRALRLVELGHGADQLVLDLGLGHEFVHRRLCLVRRDPALAPRAPLGAAPAAAGELAQDAGQPRRRLARAS